MKLEVKSDKKFSILVHDTKVEKNVSLEVNCHPYLNLEIVGENRFTFQNEKGNIFGVEIVTQNDFNLQDFEGILRFSPYDS
jgi:hypothetical protein